MQWLVSMETVEGETQKTFEKDGSVTVTLAGPLAEGLFAIGVVIVIILDWSWEWDYWQ